MLKSGPSSVREGEWGPDELLIEADSDFVLKLQGNEISKVKTWEAMEEYVNEMLEVCLAFDVPFLGAHAQIATSWNLAKELGKFAVDYYVAFCKRSGYRLGNVKDPRLYDRYLLKLVKSTPSATVNAELKELKAAHKSLLKQMATSQRDNIRTHNQVATHMANVNRNQQDIRKNANMDRWPKSIEMKVRPKPIKKEKDVPSSSSEESSTDDEGDE